MPKKEKVQAQEVEQKTPEQTIVAISKDLVAIEAKAGKITIKSEDDVRDATEFLGGVKARLKRVEELRTFFVKPLNDQVTKINGLFKPETKRLQDIETRVKRGISDYVIAEEQRKRKEEEKLQAKHAKKVEAGKVDEFAPVPTVERRDATVYTGAGKSTTKKVWKFEVTDIAALVEYAYKNKDYRFLLANEVAIRGAVAEGARELPGVRIYEDVQVSISAN